jgi:hypothetical protein
MQITACYDGADFRKTNPPPCCDGGKLSATLELCRLSSSGVGAFFRASFSHRKESNVVFLCHRSGVPGCRLKNPVNSQHCLHVHTITLETHLWNWTASLA